MNEFIDPDLGRMVAVASSEACGACAYAEDKTGCAASPWCIESLREDGRSIIWVRAEDAPRNPKAVQLPYEQIRLEAERSFAEIPNMRELINFTCAIESAVLHTNNLEAE